MGELSDPGDETPEAMGCADDCCHPDHGHSVFLVRGINRIRLMGPVFYVGPDTHDEWRELNDAE